MADTKHKKPFNFLHLMRVQNRRKMSASVLDQIIEECVPTRHINRVRSYWAKIPEPWDDKPHAAWKEWHNKNSHSFSWRHPYLPHFTKNFCNS